MEQERHLFTTCILRLISAIDIDFALNCYGAGEGIGPAASSALARSPGRHKEESMESRLSAPSASSPVSPGTAACGCIFLIRSDPAHAHLLAQSARAALAAADSVLHDDDVDPRILALVPHGAFVEPVASDSDCAPAKSPAIARARKLASEGWRVVWLVSDDDRRHPPAALAAGGAIHVCTDACAHEPQAAAVNGHGPKPLATAFNGLAG